jgi:DNA repair exonuclease SbcCD ATPase subunit
VTDLDQLRPHALDQAEKRIRELQAMYTEHAREYLNKIDAANERIQKLEAELDHANDPKLVRVDTQWLKGLQAQVAAIENANAADKLKEAEGHIGFAIDKLHEAMPQYSKETSLGALAGLAISEISILKKLAEINDGAADKLKRIKTLIRTDGHRYASAMLDTISIILDEGNP